MIYLNNTKVPGHDQKIAVGFNLAGEDMSGNSSSTAQAETGDKGKEITVTTYIKYENSKELSLLTSLAESKDANGSRTIYNIREKTCEAMKLRQVNFNANFNVRPDESLQQWVISFNLIEYRSVPEKKQERQLKKAVTVQNATGQSAATTISPTVSTTATTTTQTTTPQPLTGMEEKLKSIDSYLGANFFGGN